MATPTNPYQRGTILGLRPGDIIDGRFQVGSLVGYGGQGVVLEIKHLEWERTLALKLPLPEVVQSPVNRERFLKEAESWIRLGVHPNVVRCWFVRQISGLPGLFLDLIPGGSLEDKVKEGSFQGDQWARILKILLQITEGLIHSHSMGLVHRDIKPENILLHADGTVCLTDFGLVKSFDDPDGEIVDFDPSAPASKDSSVTGMGQFVGSPRYGAPEQWNKALTIGPTTDIYALGGLFFEMLCGRRVFDAPGENPDPLTLIYRHLKDAPPDPRTFRPDIPAQLAELCLHCLAKSSEYRPPSAKQMLEILTGLLEQVCGETYQPPTPVPDGDRADLLNNAAVSLFSLGKTKESRELFQRGLLLQAGHPECLYNSVQLDRREAKITGGESIRQIRRANANYQLALLCIEEGLGEQARAQLAAIPEYEKNGLLHRIEGDALMYAQQYEAAHKAYSEAQRSMPHDLSTGLRKQIALNRTNSHKGVIYFPLSVSCHKDRISDPGLQLFLAPNSERLIGVAANFLVTLPCGKGPEATRVPRPEGASVVRDTWWGPDLVIIQDQTGFEIWDLQEMSIIQRSQGRILTVTQDAQRFILHDATGITLFNRKTKQASALRFPDNMPPSADVRACFTLNDSGLCLLTSTGKIAQVDPSYQVTPLPWPPPLPRFKETKCFQLSLGGILYTITKAGNFNAINFAEKKLNFSLKLPFAPEKMTIDLTEKLVVVSGPKEFGVLKANGKVLLRGEGPFAVDSSRRFGLRWCEGYLMLYQLSPFRRLRTWTEKIEVPCILQFSRNGRKAISINEQGQHFVWEVDEDNRVYERELLLTPGASYEQLIESFESYLQLFHQARRLMEKKRPYHAFTSLSNARRQSGFLQAHEALQLQWLLCQKLRRGPMEAIWERLYTSGTLSTSLSENGQALLLVSKREWWVREFGTSSGAIVQTKKSQSPLLHGRYVTSQSGDSKILLVQMDGRVNVLRPDDGTVVHAQNLELGILSQVLDLGGEVFIRSAQNVAAFLQVDSLHQSSTFDLKEVDSQKAFPLSKQRILALTKQGPVVIDTIKNTIQAGLPLTLTEPRGDLTFATDYENHSLTVLGFSDGTLVVGNTKGGKVLFTHSSDKGAITGACLNIKMAVGVIVTSTGSLTVFDLTDGRVFERFTAHNEPIDSVALCPEARYISTRTRKGQFRFWELSWILLDQNGPPHIDWLPTGTLGKLTRMFKFG